MISNLCSFQGSDDKSKIQEKMHKFAQRLSEDGEGGKQNFKGLRVILCLNISILFRKIMIDVLTNNLLLQMLSNSFRDSTIRLTPVSSSKTKSYSDKAVQKIMAVTSSK